MEQPTLTTTTEPLDVNLIANAVSHRTSPALAILRDSTDGGNKFTIEHTSQKCPDLPPPPPKVRRGKRSHSINSLRDSVAYLGHAYPGRLDDGSIDFDGAKPIAFYTPERASLVLDEGSEHESEIICIEFLKHARFDAILDELGSEMTHGVFMDFLRNHAGIMQNAEILIGAFSTLRGTLTFDSEDGLDSFGRSMKFQVKRPRNDSPVETETVPTRIVFNSPILIDDDEPSEIPVDIKVRGSAGGVLLFTMSIAGYECMISDHVEKRVREWRSQIGCPCIAGRHLYKSWAQPLIPASVKSLMALQAAQILAERGVSPHELLKLDSVL